MYRIPSRRKKLHRVEKPNLIPILDAVFIFIFFLLMSASFIKIFEISSNIPLISDKEPPKKEKPLALTLKITDNAINIYTGVPGVLRKQVRKTSPDEYNLEELRGFLINLKKKYITKNTLILEPMIDISYERLIQIMDSVRMLQRTDPVLYRKNKNGIDEKVEDLFSNIIFGNIQS